VNVQYLRWEYVLKVTPTSVGQRSCLIRVKMEIAVNVQHVRLQISVGSDPPQTRGHLCHLK